MSDVERCHVHSKMVLLSLFTHAGTAMSLKFKAVFYYFYYFLGGRVSDWLVVITCGQSYSWQMT